MVTEVVQYKKDALWYSPCMITKFANFSFCSPGDQQLAAESCQALLGPQAAGRINDIIKANKCQKAEEFLDTELSMGTQTYI